MLEYNELLLMGDFGHTQVCPRLGPANTRGFSPHYCKNSLLWAARVVNWLLTRSEQRAIINMILVYTRDREHELSLRRRYL